MLLALTLACTDDGSSSGDTSLTAPEIVLNEFVADNKAYNDPARDTSDTADPNEYDDWVEVYNAGDAEAGLEGFYLTDDFDEPTKWAFPTDVSLDAGEYLLVWCDDDAEQGDLHSTIKLEENGEDLGLYYATDGGAVWANKVTYGRQQTNLASARVPDGSMTWSPGVEPTPEATNGS